MFLRLCLWRQAHLADALPIVTPRPPGLRRSRKLSVWILSGERRSQEPRINNAVFYLNSYLCEAKSSPEMTVLFIRIREKNEDTNHLVQCVCLFAVRICMLCIYKNAFCPPPWIVCDICKPLWDWGGICICLRVKACMFWLSERRGLCEWQAVCAFVCLCVYCTQIYVISTQKHLVFIPRSSSLVKVWREEKAECK